MATIKRHATGKEYMLSPVHLVGRGHVCSLRLDSRTVSGEHAVFRWTGTGWELRDLSSSNGTFVDDRALEPGAPVPVAPGSRIAFGDAADAFTMVESSAPVATARGDDGVWICATDDVLALPHPDQAELFIAEDGRGRWFAESSAGDCRPVSDQEVIVIGERRWRISLPLVREKTLRRATGPIALADVGLVFAVSRNEEHVAITVVSGDTSIDLPPRAHGYVLLTLARIRLDDRARGELPESEHGWVYIPQLVDMLGINPNQLNLAIHRARVQLRQAHVLGAVDLFERRPTSRQIRLGVARIEMADRAAGGGRAR